MGLLYPFPVSSDEADFYQIKDNKLILKTYGLPYIFWIYALLIFFVLAMMFLAIYQPMLKLARLGDDLDKTMAYLGLFTLLISPLVMFAFFFFEKRLVVSKRELKVQSYLFKVKLFESKFELEGNAQLVVDSFLDSPNMARIHERGLSHQNKGYFVLNLIKDEKVFLIDRHSRKQDLIKLKNLIEAFNNE